MSWPLPQDFNEAIQNPRSAFSDPCLKTGEPVIGPQGLPLPRSGNFADVYQIRAADGKDWAAKCFTRPVTGLELRYAKVQEALDRAALPFTVAFSYLPEGVSVRGEWRPLLKMEWVEGLLLNQVVREQAGSPKVLDALSQMWSRLAKRLREAKIAHADLQHGNVLLVPGHKSGAYGLKLIDYDGIYAPPLANMPSGEAGHPNYQHPDRATKRIYSPDLDRFPHLVIATALKGLTVLGEALWDRYDTGDNLLFTEGDFRAPRSSKLMQELWQSGHPELQSLVGHLAISCFRPIPQSPWLDQIAPDGVATPLSQEQTAAAEVALGLVPLVATVVSAPIAAPVAHKALVEMEILSTALPTAPASAGFTFDAEPARISEPIHRPSTRKPAKSGGLGAGLVAGLVGMIVLVGVLLGAGAFLLGGKKPGDELTQAPIDPSPPSPTEKDSSKPPREAAAPTVELIKPAPEPVNPPTAPSPTGAILPNRWDQTISTTGLTAIAFTADSAQLVALSARIPEVVVLDALNGAEVGRFTDHTNPPIGVCRLADGNIATMTTEEPFAIVWNPKTQRALGKLTVVAVLKGTLPAVFQVSLDARYAVTGRAGAPRTLSASGDKPSPPTGKLTVTMTDTGRVVTTIDFVSGVVRFSPDGARLLVAEDRGRVRSFRLPAGTPEADWTVPASEHPGAALTIAGDGHWVAYWTSLAATAPSRLTVFDALTGKPVATGPVVTVAKTGGASSPDGRWLAANQSSGPRGRSFKVVEAMTGEVVATAPLPDTHNFGWDGTVEFSPDRFTLAVIRPGGAIRAFRVSRDLIAAKPKIPNDMGPGPLSPPSPTDLKVLWAAKVPIASAEVAFSGDGSAVVLATADLFGRSDDAGLQAFDLRTGAPLPALQGHIIRSAHWLTPLEGDLFANYSGPAPKSEVLLWHAQTGKAAGRVPVPDVPGAEPLAVCQLSPNRQFLAVGRKAAANKPAPFRIFDLSSGQAIRSFDGFVASVAFTADSSRILVDEWTERYRWFKLPTGDPDGGWGFGDGTSTPATHHVVRVSADGTRILYCGKPTGQNSGYFLLDGKDGSVIRTFGAPAEKTGLALPDCQMSADGRVVTINRPTPSAAKESQIEVVDATTGLTRGHVLAAATWVALAPDGRAMAVHNGNAQTLTLYDLGGGMVAAAPNKGPTPMVTVPNKGPTPMAAGRLAVPDDAAVAKADEKVRGLLKEDFAKKLSTDRKALVTKLLGLAEGASNDPAERFAMLRDARDLAAEAGDPIMAIQVVEVLGRSFRVNEHHLKIEPLEKVTAGTNSATILRAVAEQALTGSEEAAAADDYESAIKLAQVAGAAARRGSLLGGLAEEADLRVNQAKKGAEAFAVVRSALEKLQTEPNDPDANLAVGRYRCLSRGQWDEGLKHLAKGSHPDFKAAAVEELSAMQDGTPSVKVADRWWSLALILPAEERRPIEARARYWYLRALPVLTGLAKVEAEKRTWLTLNTIEYRPGLIAEFTAKPPAVLKGPRARLDPTIDFSASEFADRSQANTEIQVKWTGVIVANRPGRYRLVAETRDSVRLKINGKIIFETFTNKRAKPDGMVSVGDRPLAVQVEFASLNATPHHLKLKWVAPGSDIEEIIPPDALYHDRKAEGILGK